MQAPTDVTNLLAVPPHSSVQFSDSDLYRLPDGIAVNDMLREPIRLSLSDVIRRSWRRPGSDL
jgi:hypothetical protein